MLRQSKLTLRVTEAASAVCGITFHPNGMDGGLTTVTLTLLLHTTLPRLTELSGVGWDITNIHNITRLSKNTAISQSQRYSRDAVDTNMLGSQSMSSSAFIFKRGVFASLCHLKSQQKVTISD